MTAMWLCRHNGYSGMSLFDGLVGSAYNLILTSGPIFVVVRRPLRPAAYDFDWDFPMRRLFLSRNIEGVTDAGRR